MKNVKLNPKLSSGYSRIDPIQHIHKPDLTTYGGVCIQKSEVKLGDEVKNYTFSFRVFGLEDV